jgi:hypothetical protein
MAAKENGWQKRKDRSLQRVRDHNKGNLETDIEDYNRRLRKARAADRAYARHRRAVDQKLDQLRTENELKEVWET